MGLWSYSGPQPRGAKDRRQASANRKNRSRSRQSAAVSGIAAVAVAKDLEMPARGPEEAMALMPLGTV